MLRDTEFDPVNPEEEARRRQDEELARRVRREVLRIGRGEADEEIRADMEREAAERAEAEERENKERRRRASLVRQFFTGTFWCARACRGRIPTCFAWQSCCSPASS